MTFRARIRVEDRKMRKDLRFVNGTLQRRAHVDAINYANRRVRTRIIRTAQGALGMSNQKSLRRQIRIPKIFRATKAKPNAGGVYGAFVPRAQIADGPEYVFLNRKPTTGASLSTPFTAKMKSGHRGIFVRRIGDPNKKYRRGYITSGRGKKRTTRGFTKELPIYELFTNAIGRVDPLASEAVQWGTGEYAREFARRMDSLLRTVKSV